MVADESPQGTHELEPLEIRGSAICSLSWRVSAPGKPARKGAGDDLGDHSHAWIFILPAFEQPLCRYIDVGKRRKHDQRCEEQASGDTQQSGHGVEYNLAER